MTTNHHNPYSKNMIILILCAVVIMLLLIKCESCRSSVKVEPVIIEVKDSSTKAPAPVNIEVIEPGRIPELAASKPYIIRLTDTLWIYERGEVDTAAILQDYFSKYMYVDTFRTKYGNVFVWDTVSRNKIEGRKWAFDLSVPSEIVYVTNPTPTPKKRNILFFDMGSQVSTDTTMSLMAGFTLLTKKNRMYSIDGLMNINGQKAIQGKVSFPLSFRGRK